MNILILYSTTDGQTKKIGQVLKQRFESKSFIVTLRNIDDYHLSSQSIAGFDAIVIGASVRYGKHKKTVSHFIKKQEQALKKTLFAFYSVNLTARKAEKNTPQNNPYLVKFYTRLPIIPRIDAVFAGRLAYPEYKWYDRMMIRFIMKITKGPTDPSTVKEFTDWQAVANYAEKIILTLTSTSP